NPTHQLQWLLSTDSGATWKAVPLPAKYEFAAISVGIDTGGPFKHARYQAVRIGTKDVPFVLVMSNPLATLYGVKSDASVKTIYQTSSPTMTIAGTDATGSRYLLSSTAGLWDIVDVNGNATAVGIIGSLAGISTYASKEGWITPDGGAYLEVSSSNLAFLWY